MVYVNSNYPLGITICTRFITARNFSQKLFPKLWLMQFLPSISKDFENTNCYKAAILQPQSSQLRGLNWLVATFKMLTGLLLRLMYFSRRHLLSCATKSKASQKKDLQLKIHLRITQALLTARNVLRLVHSRLHSHFITGTRKDCLFSSRLWQSAILSCSHTECKHPLVWFNIKLLVSSPD